MRKLRAFLAHLVIIFVLLDLTLQIVDICNPRMGFLDNPFATVVVWGFPIAALLLGVLVIISEMTYSEEEEQKKSLQMNDLEEK